MDPIVPYLTFYPSGATVGRRRTPQLPQINQTHRRLIIIIIVNPLAQLSRRPRAGALLQRYGIR